MSKRLTVLILVVVLGVSVFAAACGNGGTPENDCGTLRRAV